MTLSPSHASMTGAGMRPLYVHAAKLVAIPRSRFLSINSMLNVFTDGPAQVAFWPFTGSIFLVVNGVASEAGADCVFAGPHAASAKTTQSVEPRPVFFMSSPPNHLKNRHDHCRTINEEVTGVKAVLRDASLSREDNLTNVVCSRRFRGVKVSDDPLACPNQGRETMPTPAGSRSVSLRDCAA